MARRKITPGELRKLGACEKVVAPLEAEWPDGAVITKAVCLQAAELGADFEWAAKNLLSASAWDAYQKAIAPALAAYNKAIASALDAYRKAEAIAFWQAAREGK